MKILVTGCKDYPAFTTPWVYSGGMEVYVERMTRSLADRGKFTLMTAGGRSDSSARVISLGAARGHRTQPLSLLLRTLRRVLGARPDCDVINAQSPLSGLAGYFSRVRWGIPYVVTVHVFGSDRAHSGGRVAAGGYAAIESLVLSRAAGVIPTGRVLAGMLCERYPKVRPRVRAVTAAGTGVAETADRRAVRERLGIPAGEKALLFLGRLVEENGLGDLFEAAAHLAASFPRFRLLIAGTGDERQRRTLESRVRRLGLDGRVHWLGSLSGREKVDVLAATDVLVRTSFHEVFPEAYIEALSVGTPVVATPAGDTPILAEESGAIEVVPFADPPAQALALGRLLDDDRRLEEMRSRGLAYAARVTWEDRKDLYWDVLETARRAA